MLKKIYRYIIRTSSKAQNKQVIVSLRVRRGTISLDNQIARLVKPCLDFSISLNNAIAHVRKELQVSKKGATDCLEWLYLNGMVSFCSIPIEFYEKKGIQLFIRKDSKFGQVDRIIVQEVLESYYIDRLNIDKANTIVDVGGNIGTFSVYLKHLNPRLKIIAVEAERNNAELMRLNFEGLPDVYPCYGLLTYSKNRVKLLKHKSNPGANLSTAFLPTGWSSRDFEEVNTIIPSVTLEEVLTRYNLNSIDILKIDCEGCEFELFKNISSNVLMNISQIVGEYHATLEGFKINLENRLTPFFHIVEAASHKHTDACGTFYAINRNSSH